LIYDLLRFLGTVLANDTEQGLYDDKQETKDAVVPQHRPAMAAAGVAATNVKQTDVSLEGDDTFEEFALQGRYHRQFCMRLLVRCQVC
jgi:hypothetical protein